MKKILVYTILMSSIFSAYAHNDNPNNDYKIKLVEGKNLSENKDNDIKFFIEDNKNNIITNESLQMVHTEPVHVLILSSNLNDYHHVHPAISKDGEYNFEYTPKEKCNYNMWADITTQDDKQHYLPTELGTNNPNCSDEIDRTVSTATNQDGYQFTLTADNKIMEDSMSMVTIAITKDNKIVENLLPIMGASAHLVGMFPDNNKLIHIHPMNKDGDMSGELKFHIQPEDKGFLKLYLQVNITGEDIYIPFGLDVEKNYGTTKTMNMSHH